MGRNFIGALNLDGLPRPDIVGVTTTAGDCRWSQRARLRERWRPAGIAEHIPAGRSLNVRVDLASELTGIDRSAAWEVVHPRVAQTDDTDLKVDLSFFSGAFGDRGSIANIAEHGLAWATFSGAYRGMAAHYACAAEIIGADATAPIVFSGGLGRQSEALRKPSRIVSVSRRGEHAATRKMPSSGSWRLTLVQAGSAQNPSAAAQILRGADLNAGLVR